jgi:hypothetical protein
MRKRSRWAERSTVKSHTVVVNAEIRWLHVTECRAHHVCVVVHFILAMAEQRSQERFLAIPHRGIATEAVYEQAVR